MRYIKFLCFFALLFSPLAETTRGQENAVPTRPRIRREWDDFAVGSWTEVQRKRIVYDEEGSIESSSIIKTTSTLLSRENGFSQIRTKLEIDIAGKLFNPDPSSLRLGGVSEKPGEKVTYEHLLTEEIEVDDQEFKCDKFQVTIESDSGRRISRVWICDKYPFVLKMESVVTSKNSNKAVRTKASIIALDMPIEVLSDIKSGVVIRIITETDDSRAVTLEASCPEIPGGLVWQSKKVVVGGKLQEESSLRLIGYRSERVLEVVHDRPRRSGVISRIKQNRNNKAVKDQAGRNDEDRKRSCHSDLSSASRDLVRTSHRDQTLVLQRGPSRTFSAYSNAD
jgi:hypothetical protein